PAVVFERLPDVIVRDCDRCLLPPLWINYARAHGSVEQATKLSDDRFGDVVWRMRLADRDVNRSLAVELQPSCVSRLSRQFIRGQGARRAVVLNPTPAQFERGV